MKLPGFLDPHNERQTWIGHTTLAAAVAICGWPSFTILRVPHPGLGAVIFAGVWAAFNTYRERRDREAHQLRGDWHTPEHGGTDVRPVDDQTGDLVGPWAIFAGVLIGFLAGVLG